MIFATVGTHTQQFNRIVEALDRLAGRGVHIVAQTGHSTYRPVHLEAKAFFTEQEYEHAFSSARAVIAHAGAGSIIRALSLNKPLILVPRLQRYGEHTNNHQQELAAFFQKQGVCTTVEDMKDLGKAIKAVKRKSLSTGRDQVIGEIARYLQQI